MPDNASGAWDLIVAPWHLDEHIPDFPVPVGPAGILIRCRLAGLGYVDDVYLAGTAWAVGRPASPRKVKGPVPRAHPCPASAGQRTRYGLSRPRAGGFPA